ncbi:hypothetical protein [Shinella zoogloeoides]
MSILYQFSAHDIVPAQEDALAASHAKNGENVFGLSPVHRYET